MCRVFRCLEWPPTETMRARMLPYIRGGPGARWLPGGLSAAAPATLSRLNSAPRRHSNGSDQLLNVIAEKNLMAVAPRRLGAGQMAHSHAPVLTLTKR